MISKGMIIISSTSLRLLQVQIKAFRCQQLQPEGKDDDDVHGNGDDDDHDDVKEDLVGTVDEDRARGKREKSRVPDNQPTNLSYLVMLIIIATIISIVTIISILHRVPDNQPTNLELQLL